MLLAMGVPPPCRLLDGDYVLFAMKRALGLELPRCSGRVNISANALFYEQCYLPEGHSGAHAKCGGHSEKCLRFMYPGRPWEPATDSVCGCYGKRVER